MTSPDPQPGIPRLVALNSPLVGQMHYLRAERNVIGRNADCEVQLDLISVSRQHACVERMDGRWYVSDMGSRNGIMVGGRPVPLAELEENDVIQVGEVELRFETAPAAEAPPDVAAQDAALAPVRPLTGNDILAASQGAGPRAHAAQAHAAGEPATQRKAQFRLIVCIVIGVLIAVVASALVMSDSAPKAVSEEPIGPILVNVNGNKLILIKKRSGDFSMGNVRVDDDTLVDVSRYDERWLLVTGTAGGSTAVHIVTDKGHRYKLDVLVRGRRPDPLDDLTYDDIAEADRLRMADEFMRNAALLESQHPYLAKVEYEKAVAVLEPVRGKGEVYLAARRGRDAMKEVVSGKWDVLYRQIKVAYGLGDLPRAEELITDARTLIPDDNDPRFQWATGARDQILQEVLDDKN